MGGLVSKEIKGVPTGLGLVVCADVIVVASKPESKPKKVWIEDAIKLLDD
jgi:regulator of extracellular matrix RemA (YlzA/DUF370 family)